VHGRSDLDAITLRADDDLGARRRSTTREPLRSLRTGFILPILAPLRYVGWIGASSRRSALETCAPSACGSFLR